MNVFLALPIVLVYSVNFHIIMQHLKNIFLNFHCKILKIERVTANLRRRLEKKLFCGIHNNSQQNYLKKKTIKMHLLKEMFLEVTLGRFFSIFQFFVDLGSQKIEFLLKNRLICYCKINNYLKKTKKLPGIPGESCEEVLCKISKRLVQ